MIVVGGLIACCLCTRECEKSGGVEKKGRKGGRKMEGGKREVDGYTLFTRKNRLGEGGKVEGSGGGEK